MDKIYDVIIIGGGPGSMSAALYAQQMGLNALLIEKETFGGQVAETSSVENYLGFKYITGTELSEKMHAHIESTGIEIVKGEVVKTSLADDIKIVFTHSAQYKAYCVIIGIGTMARNLGCENERNYINKGISYSSLRDREKYIGKNVAVVGGGNSAIEDALYLSEKCQKVYLVHRRCEFRADAGVTDRLKQKIAPLGNIELVLECKPHSIDGDDFITTLNVTHIPTNSIKKLEVDCIFVAIGRGANTDIIDEVILRDNNGYIITDERMNTNIGGVYAIGDIRNTPLRQIVTAVADGAIAGVSALNYVRELKKKLQNN